MEGKLAVDVAVIKTLKNMKLNLIILSLFIVNLTYSQDTIVAYKKRILDKTEIDLIGSYYTQSGNNAAVTGGIGNEDLFDVATSIQVSIPLNEDEVLRISGGISAYTSASSSNLNPFDLGYNKEDNPVNPTGSPWTESSGASRMDTWKTGLVSFEHNSDDRTFIWDANISFASEFDYKSVGFGGGISKAWNEENTSLGLKGNIFLDAWSPESPIEIVRYIQNGGNSTTGFFQNVNILDANGNAVDYNTSNYWKPINNTLLSTNNRNSYNVSLVFSQILSKRAKFALNLGLISQNGWLANPMQRVYFKDIDNYYVGNKEDIINYTNSSNISVFQLADDIERLPSSRIKIPVGLRLNYYINERFVVKTFLRYYTDNWGVSSQTLQFDLPIKINQKITLYPTYRFYSQTKADYFAGYEEHLSSQEFYTSDYDLSKYNANQFGVGIKYKDIFSD